MNFIQQTWLNIKLQRLPTHPGEPQFNIITHLLTRLTPAYQRFLIFLINRHITEVLVSTHSKINEIGKLTCTENSTPSKRQ